MFLCQKNIRLLPEKKRNYFTAYWSTRFCDMDDKLKRLKEEAESAGLYININKRDES